MKKQERADFVFDYLNAIYLETPIPLNHNSIFELLVAVLLSAQCTDERVNIVTPVLFSKANTPKMMVKLSVEEIHDCISSCGLAPKKSKAIAGLSRILIDKFPTGFEGGYINDNDCSVGIRPKISMYKIIRKKYDHKTKLNPIDTTVYEFDLLNRIVSFNGIQK